MKLLRYSAAMIIFPVATFYFFFWVVFGGDKGSLGWSGIAAVVAANIVIAAYVKMAWDEDKEEVEAAQHRLNSDKTD